jgi:tRNA modification GTPase
MQRLDSVHGQVTRVLHEARQGCLLRDGLDLAIIGRPNAGKSSLLNALSGQDSAIVTEIPGTTRDVLRERIDIEGIPVHVVDTAGIRDTDDRIEAEGVRRARRALQSADIVLLVFDASRPEAGPNDLEQEVPANAQLIRVANKIDLLAGNDTGAMRGRQGIAVSALSGEGLPELKQTIIMAAGGRERAEGSFSARQRHVDALERSREHIDQGRAVMATGAGELLAEELRQAQQALGEITGEKLPDDLLGDIFSSFCIGK